MDDHRLIELEEDQEGLLEDEDSNDEDEEDYEEEDAEELIPAEMTSPSVSTSIADCTTLLGAVQINDSLLNDSNEEGKGELIRGEVDGLFCPICYEAWSSGGDHQICCVPCGHIYGLSCIKKWLQRRRSSGKCPQCNALCTLKDVRLLYANRLCAPDEDLHKKVRLLEAKCADLEKKAISDEDYAMHVKNTAILVQQQNEMLRMMEVTTITSKIIHHQISHHKLVNYQMNQFEVRNGIMEYTVNIEEKYILLECVH